MRLKQRSSISVLILCSGCARDVGMRGAERRKLNILERKCLRYTAGVTRMEIISTENVHIRNRVMKELSAEVGTRVLRRFV